MRLVTTDRLSWLNLNNLILKTGSVCASVIRAKVYFCKIVIYKIKIHISDAQNRPQFTILLGCGEPLSILRIIDIMLIS